MTRSIVGYTLIELLVTMSLVAILSTVAIPTYQHSSDKRSADKAASSLQSALSLARQTAITRGEKTIVCPSVDGKSCEPGTDWSKGGIAFVDINDSGQFEPGQELLERIYGTKKGSTLESTRDGAIVFNTFGLASGTNQTISYANATEQKAFKRSVVISQQGRIRVEGPEIE